ncbi:hypothetical protein ACFY36_09325 [Actinoplanes sp. NPDC000266]
MTIVTTPARTVLDFVDAAGDTSVGTASSKSTLRRRRGLPGRNYRGEPVADDVAERVVKVLHRAPSAGFSQGHRIAVVGKPFYLQHGFQPWISQAPVQVALGIREASYHERYTEADKLEAGWGRRFPGRRSWRGGGCRSARW